MQQKTAQPVQLQKQEDAQEDAYEARLFLALVAVLVVVVAIFVYALMLNRAPEAFTQTWLEDTPKTAVVGQAASFSFIIDSHESSATTYQYSISAEGGIKRQGSITLEPGQNQTISEQITFTHISPAEREGKTKVLIEISRPGLDEPYSLWFWVAVSEF